MSSNAFDAGDYRFSFAVVADTHVKPEMGDDSSPWQVNALATARARWVAREIARYNPSFVVHLGDLVHPVPELPTFGAAVELVQSIFRSHHNRLHVAAGNHDIGDKPNRAMPAKMVHDEWVGFHEQVFGPSWTSFDRDGMRFVIVNNAILNSGQAREQAQRRWLEETLRSAYDRRIVLFMHYPLFMLRPDEEGNYDNIDEPARSDMLALIRNYRVEAVIAGHVHNFFYHRVDGTEFYAMPATSFVRQDYAEMYRAEALHENGRNDAEKLGFAIVDIYRDGHIVNYVRSYGQTLAAEEAATPVAPRPPAACFPHPKRPGGAPLGVFLRHPWAETIALPYNGPMDEFLRKEVRNDYQVAALWRLGIRHARVPLRDLIDATTRARLADLVANGHRFTVFGFGVPMAAAAETIFAHAALIDRYECVLPIDAIGEEANALAEFRTRLGRPVLLSRVATSAEDRKVGSRMEHFVSHGFRPDQMTEIEALRERVTVDGFVIRAAFGTDLVALAASLDDWVARRRCALDLHLRLASHNPAENVIDDGRILAAIAELFVVGLAFPRLTLMLDTFMDIDRGYFVRHGLIDRRCNFRPAGLAVEAMAAFLGNDGGTWSLTRQEANGVRALILRGRARLALIALPMDVSAKPLDHDTVKAYGVDPAASVAVPLDQPWTIAPDLSGRPAGGILPPLVAAPVMIISDGVATEARR